MAAGFCGPKRGMSPFFAGHILISFPFLFYWAAGAGALPFPGFAYDCFVFDYVPFLFLRRPFDYGGIFLAGR